MSKRWCALLIVVLAACSSDAGLGPKTTNQLHFLRLQDTVAFTLAVQSFWAHNDRDSELRFYTQVNGETDSTEFLRFKVPQGGLFKLPDGTPLGPQDSVLITVAADPANLVFSFQPSGLQFSANNPAQLEIQFAEANQDLNDDGQVNAVDDSLKAQLQLWRQETVGGPWVPVTANIEVELEDAEADILGFTNYALAY